MLRKLRVSGASLTIAIGLFLPSVLLAGPAHASTGYSHAQRQLTFSLNCNNPSAPCQNVFGLGGVWGWVALFPGGTGNAQVTDCAHTLGGGGPVGAQHFSYDPTYIEISSPEAPSPITATDPNGKYLVFTDATSALIGLPPFPASYGHYSISFLGAKGQVTIAP